MSKPIISLIVIILSLGAAFLYVKPEYNIMVSHRTDVQTLNDIFSQADSINKLLTHTQETLDGVDASDLARFSVFLPETSDSIRLADNLQQIGLNRGLILRDIKVDVPSNAPQKSAGSVALNAVQGAVQGAVNIFTIGGKENLSIAAYDAAQTAAGTAGSASSNNKNYVTTTAHFSVTATMQSFNLLLNDFEKSLRMTDVTELSFTEVALSADEKKLNPSAPLIYQYSVSISTYSLK